MPQVLADGALGQKHSSCYRSDNRRWIHSRNLFSGARKALRRRAGLATLSLIAEGGLSGGKRKTTKSTLDDFSPLSNIKGSAVCREKF